MSNMIYNPTVPRELRKLTQIRFTDNERKMLKEIADAEKVSRSEIVRILVRERHAKLEQKKQPQQG